MGIAKPMYHVDFDTTVKNECDNYFTAKHTEKDIDIVIAIEGRHIYCDRSLCDCELVIYKSLYDGNTYARPLNMFLEKVPEGKYNPSGQTYRFELINKQKAKVKFYEFNNFSYYALMAVDIDEADPIKVAVNVYKDEIADIEDEDKCVPDEISLEEALEKFKKAQFKKYTDEEKIKQFYETIDLDTEHEQDYAILLVDGCLC